tara:strand:+ start:2437 stop:2916 length:480 start_codon:yes stop_codon:yes gene_type:complete
MAQLLSGWGRAGFGELGWDEGTIPVTLTAPAAATVGAPQAGVNAQAIASVPGLAGSVGSLSVAVDGEAIVTLTGAGTVGTSALGTATLSTNNNISVVGYSMTSSLGSVTTVSKADISIELEQATSLLGVTFVWSDVDDAQSTTWNTVTTTNNPNWEKVA